MKSKLRKTIMFASKQAFYVFCLQVLTLQLLMASEVRTQNINHVKVQMKLVDASLNEVLSTIEDKTDFTFVYNSNAIDTNTRWSFKDEWKVADILHQIAEKKNYKFRQIGKNIYMAKSKRRKSVKNDKAPLEVGLVSGIIRDKGNSVLSFASVEVKDVGKGVIAGEDGKFKLRLPEGNYTLIIRYLGYVEMTKEVEVLANQTTYLEIAMAENTEELDAVVIYGNLTRGQAKALNEQRNAQNIKNVVSYEQFSKYPDRNAAEALQRVPGVAISRDQGEGELVSIRGMSPRFNAVQVNGQRIPSPDPGTDRAVGLDLLQVDLMGSIEVNKTLTPDMDGDAIGGSVNFRLKQAPEQALVNVAASGGFNQQQSEFDDFGQSLQSYSAVLGRRFFNNKLGIIAAGSYYKTNRGSLLNQYTYDGNTTIVEEKRNNDYDVRRERYGITFSPDLRINDNHNIKLVANYNVYDDDEIRRRADFLVGDQEEEREIRNRGEYQTHFLYQLIGEHQFKPFKLDYSVNFTRAKEEMPDRTYWRFARDVDYSDLTNEERFNLTVTDNPGGDVPLFLNRLRFDDNITEDEDISAQVDLTIPLKVAGMDMEFKTGGKLLFKDRTSDQVRFNLGVDSEVNPVPLNGGTFGFEDVRFDDPEVAALGLGEFSLDEDRGDGEDYVAEEDVQAFYGQLTLNLTDKLSVVTGARFERTENRYTGIRADDFAAINAFSFTNILPSAQFKYSFTDKSILRVAYSTGFTRPPFSSLVPGEDVIDPDERVIRRRNPEIEASNANNFDIIYEKYSRNLGIMSIGAFGKFIDNQILTERTMEEIDGTLFTVFQSVNGERAQALGLEFSLVRKFINDGIPILKWFGVNANYTYTFTEQTIFGIEDNEVVTREVPFQSPEHVFNLGLFYENPNMGLTFTLSGNYRDAIIIDAGSDEFSDVYFGSQFHLDASASKDIGKHFSAFVQLNNLTDQLEEEYFSDPSESFSRIHQTEGYGFWGSVGLRFQLQ